jgi:hypothetical protein
MRWSACCGSRYSATLMDMRTRTTPSACATIRRCAGLSAGKRLTVTQHRRARWAASKLSGLRHPRTSLLLPTCLASGSSSCTAAAPASIVLDMDSSVSSTHGEQEMSVWNGHYACACYYPLFVFNQFGESGRCALRPGNVHSADGWDGVLTPVVALYQGKVSRIYFRADAAFAMPEVYEFLEAEQIKYAIHGPLHLSNWLIALVDAQRLGE